MRIMRGATQYLLAIGASVGAAGVAAVLGTWWSVVACSATGLVAVIICGRGVIRSKVFWFWVRRTAAKHGPWPSEAFSKKAASDDPKEAIWGLDEAVAFVEDNPELCLDTLVCLHRTRPDMHAAVAVRQKYARFRLVAIRIMVKSEPGLIATVLRTLTDLLRSRIEDVRASATTELGELCSLANDPSARVPRTWQCLCFDLLDKSLTDFLDRGMVPHAQSQIRHVASTASHPEMFRDTFAHLVSRVVSGGECKAEYVEAMCELLSRTVPGVVELARPDDLQRLQRCANLCLHRSHCMNTHSTLRVFEDHVGEPNKNDRVWRRLHKGDGVSDLTIRCGKVNDHPCPKACCKGTDISLRGTNSRTCAVQEASVLTDVRISLDLGGTQKDLLIPRAVVQRRHRDVNRNQIDGAGIAFLDWGSELDTIAKVICS